MADATNTVTVDGVEPSIPVVLVKSKYNPERVKLYTDDRGGHRYLSQLDDSPLLVTHKDLGVLGPFEVEILQSEVVKLPMPNIGEEVPAQKSSGVMNPSPVTVGQSSPQA